jgi:hypothetical protein
MASAASCGPIAVAWCLWTALNDGSQHRDGRERRGARTWEIGLLFAPFTSGLPTALIYTTVDTLITHTSHNPYSSKAHTFSTFPSSYDFILLPNP